MAYFIQQTDENGEVKFVEVPDGDLQLPEEELNKRVAQSELFRKTVDESKQRKEVIKKLRKQFDDLEKPDQGTETPAAPEAASTQDAAPAKPLDIDTLFQEFKQRLTKEQQDTQAQQAAEDAALNELLTKNGLGEDALEVLRDSKNPEVTAKKLAKSAYNFGSSSTGNTKRNPVGNAVGSAFKDLGLD